MSQVDITVFGATGFTGRLAALELATHAPPGLKIAIAGRYRDKLEGIARSLPRAVEIIVADVSRPDSLDAMCARTSILVTTVGPFVRFGSDVVRACVTHGCDYLDITGETPWAREMIDTYGAQAADKGLIFVPFSGYDSVPSDLTTLLALRALGAKGKARVQTLMSAKGGVNGGTLASASAMFERGDERLLADPQLLNSAAWKATHSAPTDGHGVRWHAESQRWLAPFFMAPINSRVVRRSVELFAARGEPYAEDVEYREAMGTKSWALAQLIGTTTRASEAALAVPRLRKLLLSFAPKPGEGPSEAAMRGGMVKTLAFATDGDRVTRAEFSAVGDPGNVITVMCLVESALVLATSRSQLPRQRGFLTPATAFGEHLVARLQARGVKLQVT